jgi:ribosomal-protein-alanine N-acetyltransferase
LTSKIFIRKLSLDSIPQVVDIEREVFQNPWGEDIFYEELYHKKSIYLIIVNEEDRVLAYTGGRILNGEFHICNLAVRKEYRRAGIASFLLKNLISYINTKEKINLYSLIVRKSNKGAISLYLEHNFQLTQKIQNYYHNPTEDGIYMVLEDR